MSKKNRERRRFRQVPGQTGFARKPGDPKAAEAAAFLKNFEQQLKVPQPTTWPGACDASLARPDLVKLDYARFALEQQPGRGKSRQLQRSLEIGPLEFIPDLDHWAMEEFLWHGLPGDDWSPLEAFLQKEGQRFSPQAADQLRRWRHARFGFYEIGPVQGDLVTMRRWDPFTQAPTAADFQAIALNIGGVNAYREQMDKIQIIYVAPWSLEPELFCVMGYGMILPADMALMMTPLLGLEKPELAVRPHPWEVSPVARKEYAATWRQRYWPDWLGEQLQFPFETVIYVEGMDRPIIREATSLLPTTPEKFEEMGIYFTLAELSDRGYVLGGTQLNPCDPTSRSALAMAEYRAYRDLVGLPRGVRNQPDVVMIERE